MPTDQLAMLKELSGSKLYSSAILGTFQFDGEFFENEVLPILNQLDITNIIVLTDTQSYREANDLGKAGQEYYIDHVRCPGIHHPKFVALLGRDHGRAFVGSANLTDAGWQRSGELMTTLDYPNEADETLPAFSQLREFIEHSTEQIHGSRATAAITEAFRDAPWLPETPTAEPRQLKILHNYTDPLLSQVLDHIGDKTIEEIEICSPFFSGTDETTFAELCNLSPKTIQINLQPDNVKGFDATVLEEPCFDEIDVRVNEYALTGDDTDRYLHAKLLLLKGPAGAWAFYGSPNFTTPALLKTRTNGNIELGVLRYETDPTYFDYLLDTETVTREQITPNSVSYRTPNSTESDNKNRDFYLTDAYLKNDGTLIIEHDEGTSSQATVYLRQAGSDEELEIILSESNSGRLQCQDERIPQLCRQSVQARITLEFQDDSKSSDARWVALPTLEQTARPSEVQAVEASDGREGLIEVLDRLPTWGLICEFLEGVNFESMDVATRGRRINISDPTPSDGDEMEEWDPKGRDEILEQKADLLLNRLETTRENLILNETDPELFTDFVNQYVALCKLVLWWECQELHHVTHLAKVRSATKILADFIESLETRGDLNTAQAIEREHSLFEHAAITMCYVDELQRQAGYESGPNENVYAVFKRTHRTVLEAFEKLRGEPSPTTEDLADCLVEYSAIDSVSVNATQVRQYCKELIEQTD